MDSKDLQAIITSAARIITHYEEQQISLRNAMKILPEIMGEVTPNVYSQIHAIVFETVRHQNVLNRIIHLNFQRFLANKIQPMLRNLLRVVTYLLVIPKTLENELRFTVASQIILNSTNDPTFTSLLENYLEALKNWNLTTFLETIDDPEEKIAVKYSHPTWLVRDWIKFFGDEAEKILESANQIQPVYLRLNLLNHDKEESISRLREEEVEVEEDSDLFDIVKVISWKIPIPRLSSFKEGLYYIQDKGSALISHVLDPQEGEVVLDACAAPGGKTTHIALLQKDLGKIIALDNHFRRMNELKTKIKLFKLKSISPILYDLRLSIKFNIKFDKILIDAPCSGSGTFASRPDSKWRVDRHQVKWLNKLQYSLLSNAASVLKDSKNCSLVYATCSLHPYENEYVVKQFLGDHPNFELQPQKVFLGTPIPEYPLAQRLFPHLNQTQGFSIFKLGLKTH